MATKKLDIQSIFQEELKKQRTDRLGHVQQVNQSKRASENVDFRVHMAGETVPEADSLGPQQVESLLAFVIDEPLERALENAERDNIIYDALGEHRILGKAKKKPGSKISSKRADK
jgi:hypothetical protein